jgi:hypothetical protein
MIGRTFIVVTLAGALGTLEVPGPESTVYIYTHPRPADGITDLSDPGWTRSCQGQVQILHAPDRVVPDHYHVVSSTMG